MEHKQKPTLLSIRVTPEERAALDHLLETPEAQQLRLNITRVFRLGLQALCERYQVPYPHSEGIPVTLTFNLKMQVEPISEDQA